MNRYHQFLQYFIIKEFKTTIKSNISFIETNSEHQKKVLTLVSPSYFWDRGQETEAIGNHGLRA